MKSMRFIVFLDVFDIELATRIATSISMCENIYVSYFFMVSLPVNRGFGVRF